jgi:hypothetical protein
MPKISGFDMLDILRSTTETKSIKVIMMTALSSEDQRLRGEQLGADRYLVKSQVGIEDVVRTVHEVLADAPILPGANAFGSNAPSAVPRPAPATVPARPEPAAPMPVAATTPTPAPMPAPTPAPAAVPTPVAPAAVPQPPQPQQPVAPVAPVSTTSPQPVTTTLPQPTAPFSTTRPAGLADRIIQPLEKPEEDAEPLGSLMDRELGNLSADDIDAPAAPAVPPAPPIPAPQEHTGISFEETPRQ